MALEELTALSSALGALGGGDTPALAAEIEAAAKVERTTEIAKLKAAADAALVLVLAGPLADPAGVEAEARKIIDTVIA